MFRRGLAILLCSAMLVGSLPEMAFAAENVETTETAAAENDASPEAEEDVQTSKAAVLETQTVTEPEKTETKETEKTETKETEKMETKTAEETLKPEGDADASEKTEEPATQEPEKTETKIAAETQTVVNPVKEDIVTETVPEMEKTSIAEPEEVVEEAVTVEQPSEEAVAETVAQEEMTEEAATGEIENAQPRSTETLGNEYVTVSNVKADYNSISFDYEVKNHEYIYIYVADSKEGDRRNVYYGEAAGSCKITGLNPKTAYEVSFEYSTQLFTFSETTAECPYNVKYEVTSTKADAIHLNAQITAKDGAQYELPERFILGYNCYDENGKRIFEGSSQWMYNTAGTLPVNIETDIKDAQYIFGNTKYTVEMWIAEPYNSGGYGSYGSTEFGKEGGRAVTTAAPAVSDVEITFLQDASDSSVMNYTLTTGSYKDRAEGTIFWRLKGSRHDYDYSDFSTENGSATGAVEYLSLGSTYEYLINVAGFKKTGEFTNGEAKLKWNMSCDAGALDMAVTFRLDEATKTPGATYSIEGAYELYGSGEGSTLEPKEGGLEDVYYADWIYPNQKYEIKFYIWEELPDGTSNNYTAFETVTTKASAVKTANVNTYFDAVSFDIAFDPSVRTDYLSQYDERGAYPYVKNEDGKYIRLKDADEIYLRADKAYSNYTIWGLESNKTYEISFGDEWGTIYDGSVLYYEYGTMTFKTPADDRTITTDTPEAGVSGFKLKGTLKGSTVPYDGGTEIYLLRKESGTDKWVYADSTYVYGNDEQQGAVEKKFTLSVFGLEAGKNYDYAVGMATDGFNSANPDVSKLKGLKTGTVKLNADARSVEVTDTVSFLDGVVIKAKLSGNYFDNGNEACMLYREKGKADVSWDRTWLSFSGYNRTTDTLITTCSGEALKPGMTYEFKLCMDGKLPEKEEDYAVLKGGDFTYTQPADDRALDVKVTAQRTKAAFEITLTGSSRAVYNYVTLFRRKKGSEAWEYCNRGFVFQNAQPTVYMTMQDLSADTEYEYTVGISNTPISSVDDIVIGRKMDGFATKDERKLGTPIITLGYTYADLEVGVDGLMTNDNSRVTLYTKDTTQQDASWISRNGVSVNSNDNTARFSINLEQGKTYKYALVISDNYNGIDPDSEEFEKLSADRKLVGDLSAKKSSYTLDVTQDNKSVFNKVILNIKAASTSEFDEKNFKVELTVRESETQDFVYGNNNISLDSVDHAAEAILTNTSENTKYDVTAILYAWTTRNGSFRTEEVAKREISFVTKAAEAPTELKTNVEEIFLNSWNMSYNEYYSNDVVDIIVPDGASDKVIWNSSDPEIASVTDSGIVSAKKPGDVTLTAVSTLNANARAEVKVHVKDYAVILIDKTTNTVTPVPYNSVYVLMKNEIGVSENIAYATTTDGGETFTTNVTATGTSDDPNIAYWDEEKQCIVSKNVGSTWIVLNADGFKTDLYVTVYADSPAFDVKISPTEDAQYPALKQNDVYQIAAGESNYYRVSAEANPVILDDYYTIYDVITFTSSDESVLKVNESGYVTGLKKGTATVTAAYDMKKIKDLIASLAEDNIKSAELEQLAKLTDSDVNAKKKEVKFDVRPLPTQSLQEVHVITNVHKTLGDVKTLGEGWNWRDPETPLYALPDKGNAYYEFEAEYTGAEFYNCEKTVAVYISTIAGVEVINNKSNVISADNKDSMNLIVKPVVYGYAGLMEGPDYTVEFPPVQNITVTSDTAGHKVTAGKKGKYVLKPEIKVGGTAVAAGNYAITAVDGKLVDHIDIEPATESPNVTIKGSMIFFDSNAGVENFKLKATAYDREGNVSDTKLTWTITDKAVADVDAKTNDKEVTVKVKGDGHAVIQVTAADEAKAAAKFRFEARNRKPRVEGDKITVNTAYDYQSSAGIELSAAQYGNLSVATVYGEDIDSVQVVTADVEDGAANLNGKVSKEFEAYEYNSFQPDSDSEEDGYAYESYYVIEPVNPDMAAGKYTAKLAVTTSSGFVYTYPLAITVINKEPKVAAKMSNTMNLFYLNQKGWLDITLEKNKSKGTDFGIERIKWSGSEGFRIEDYSYSLAKTPNVERYYLDGSKVKVTGGKPAAAEGKVTITLAGVRKPYELSVKVKCSYKKPKLTTVDSMTKKNVSTIVSSVPGGKSGSFYILADKNYLSYYGDNTNSAYFYNERRCANDKVAVGGSGSLVSFTSLGTEEQFEIPLTVDAYNWREALTVTHKVKTVKPTAVLSNAKLTYNTKYDGEVSARVYFKDYPYVAYTAGNKNYSIISAVDAVGADTASQELLTNGKLQINYAGSGRVTVKLNAAKLDNQVLKGASYVLTPYCFDSATGENKPLNTLALKVSFTDKPVTAKISGKGKLDLTNRADSFMDEDDWSKWLASSNIMVTPKFANLSSGYRVTNVELTGEYSKYFMLEEYDSVDSRYIVVSDEGRGKLKAGQNYNLSVIYTLQDDGGNSITVKSSNVLKVKPIQKAPKLTVVGDNKILYAASPSLYRRCQIRTPYYSTRQAKDYYAIESAYGFVDANKDGKADIEVKLDGDYDSSYEGYAFLRIKLTDEDAVLTAAKGKTYTVPVTVRLVGRDGISKDAVVKVKVTVKR